MIPRRQRGSADYAGVCVLAGRISVIPMQAAHAVRRATWGPADPQRLKIAPMDQRDHSHTGASTNIAWPTPTDTCACAQRKSSEHQAERPKRAVEMVSRYGRSMVSRAHRRELGSRRPFPLPEKTSPGNGSVKTARHQSLISRN